MVEKVPEENKVEENKIEKKDEQEKEEKKNKNEIKEVKSGIKSKVYNDSEQKEKKEQSE